MSKNVISDQEKLPDERTDKVEDSYAKECDKTAGEAIADYAVEKNSIVQSDTGEDLNNIESYSCENCDFSFDEEDDLDTHKELFHDIENEGKGQDEKTPLVDDLQCDECNFVSKIKQGLKTHKTSKHMSKEKNQSLKTVTRDSNLKMKKKIHI